MAGVGARSRCTAATGPTGDPMRVRRQEAFEYPNSYGADHALRIVFLLTLPRGGGPWLGELVCGVEAGARVALVRASTTTLCVLLLAAAHTWTKAVLVLESAKNHP